MLDDVAAWKQIVSAAPFFTTIGITLLAVFLWARYWDLVWPWVYKNIFLEDFKLFFTLVPGFVAMTFILFLIVRYLMILNGFIKP